MFDGSEANTLFPPCLIVAHANAAYAARIASALCRLGWDLYLARSGPEARRLAHLLKPNAVILHTDLPEESGWLTCDKLTREQPLARVILVSDNLSRRNRDFAVFVGASALVGRGEKMPSRLDQLLGPPQPRRGYENQLGTSRRHTRWFPPSCAARQ